MKASIILGILAGCLISIFFIIYARYIISRTTFELDVIRNDIEVIEKQLNHISNEFEYLNNSIELLYVDGNK